MGIKINEVKMDKVRNTLFSIDKGSENHQEYVSTLSMAILSQLDGKDISHYEQEIGGVMEGITTTLRLDKNTEERDKTCLNLEFKLESEYFLVNAISVKNVKGEILKYDSFNAIDLSEVMCFIIEQIGEAIKLSQYYIATTEEGLWENIMNHGSLVFDVELEKYLDNKNKKGE